MSIRSGLAIMAVLLTGIQPALAAGKIDIGEDSWISIGAGARMGYARSDSSNAFDISSVRLYVDGQAHKYALFTFNAVCSSCAVPATNDELDVLDAIARFELSPKLNFWVGRMLTPADRIEMNGPYYGLSWNQYTVPLLPSDQVKRAGFLGRDDGVTVWGTLDKFQYAVGVFDGVDGGPNSDDDNVLWAGRFAYNFLSMENNPAYYTSSTYYGGGGDIFTVAVSAQHQSDGVGSKENPSDFRAVIVDVLYEKVLAGGAVLTAEGEYKAFDADLSAGGVAQLAAENARLAAMDENACNSTFFCLFDGHAYFLTVGYLLGGEPVVGPGRFQPYLRYTSNEPDSGADSDLTEFGLNYIIKGHNLRLNLNYTTGTADLTGRRRGLGGPTETLFFGVQIQI